MAFRLRNPNDTFVTVAIGEYVTTIPAQVMVGPFAKDQMTDDIRQAVARGILLRIDELDAPTITPAAPPPVPEIAPLPDEPEDDAESHDTDDMTGGYNG